MPMTAEMRRGIDQIRDYLYGGGYPDPVSNAEHLSFLFFFYLIEGIDRDNALRAKAAKRDHESIFAGEWELRNPLNEKWGSGVDPDRADLGAERSGPPGPAGPAVGRGTEGGAQA